jgi:membrane protein DedA with SNARE-associated domain
MEEIRSWPWAWAWLALFVIVLLRAGATYALGRLVAAGVLRRREPGPRVRAAAARVDRWGPPVVTASFLTVGAQTVVNAGAGLARMSVPRYLVGLVPGAAVWATIWSTIGAGAFLVALRGGSDRDEAVALGLGALVLVAVVAAVAARRRRGRLEA